MIIKTLLSKEDFLRSDASSLFQDEKFDRKFMKIKVLSACFKFSWGSDLIEPMVSVFDDHLLCIGVDLNFIIYSLREKKLVLSLSLYDFFYELINLKNKIFVATELHVYEIDTISFEVKTLVLPEIFSHFSLTGGKLEAICINDYVVILMRK